MRRENQELALEIYQSFCESEGGIDNHFQKVWNEYEEEYGYIENGSLLEKLILAAITFGIENASEIEE